MGEGFTAETRAKAEQQEREEVFAALQYAASFHCSVEEWKDCEKLEPKLKEKLIFVEKKRGNETSNGVVCWTNKYRCTRCGRGSKYRKMPGKSTCQIIYGEMEKATSGRPRFVKKSGQVG